jgi:hypothetical protein
METISMSIVTKMNEENVIYTCNTIIQPLKKKKKEILSFVTSSLPVLSKLCLSEISQIQKGDNCMYDLTYRWYLK